MHHGHHNGTDGKRRHALFQFLPEQAPLLRVRNLFLLHPGSSRHRIFQIEFQGAYLGAGKRETARTASLPILARQ